MATAKASRWKRGRGKMGILEPLIGSWKAEADFPVGPIECSRTSSRILGGA